MKYASHNCCDKTIHDDEMTSSRDCFFSELYKVMVNKVIFVGFWGAVAPIAPPGLAHGISYVRLTNLTMEYGWNTMPSIQAVTWSYKETVRVLC